jgi:hypothetical protein
MSKEDLKPLTSEQAQKIGRKGGQATSIAKKLSKRTKCNINCPIYEKCWAQPYSKTQYEGQCALKKMPERLTEYVNSFRQRNFLFIKK